MTPDGSSLVLAGEVSSRYVVDRELGVGATSNVYLAHDQAHDRMVAIKLLRRELAESLSTDRFLREIRLTARLQHAYIVPILDSGVVDGRPFCVLPYMAGGTLRARLQRQKQLPLDEALTIGLSIARALEFAHSQNIIHRDVKPENILFSGDQACLSDFGIARAIEGAAGDLSTSTGIVRGTPAYMSPEQAAGEHNYDGRSDIYSLGCVLYEMVAGVPAFTGPSSQSVLAQRLTHMPQPIRTYRPTTPVVVQRVIERALATGAADRYQTARELAIALEGGRVQIAAATAGLDSASSWTPRVGGRRAILLLTTAIAAIGLLSFAGLQAASRWSRRSVQLDTTRVAVFFADNTQPAGTESAAGDMLRAALRRWQGLAVVPYDETSQAVRGHRLGASSPPDAWRTAASELRAGRYVLGRVARTPTGRAVVGEYRDVSAGLLHSVEIPLPADSSRVADAYWSLADSLVLRGATDEGAIAPGGNPRNLFATQSFIRGLAARGEWNLARADSMFARATELDPGLARAHLWLAQVRVWRALPDDRWANSAERAIGDSTALAPAERMMAGALIALLHHEYAVACDRYRSLIAADARSFVGWYGLGDCAERDKIVVRDSRSPSGWRFRTSYYQAITAYARAFELLPATYHGFQAASYSRLRELLFTSTRALRRGLSADSPPRDFLARARLVGDTIAMIPFERERILSGDPKAVVSPAAVDLLRTTFHQIAARWTAAFPNSPEAKEAVAISLELQGDAAALDSIRSAERLAADPGQRLRFAAAGVILRVKFAIPDGVSDLEGARHTADSLLRAYNSPSGEEAGVLAPLAALTGRCEATKTLLRRWAKSQSILGTLIPADIVADASVLKAAVAMDCPMRDTAASATRIAARIGAAVATEEKRRATEYYLLAAGVNPENPSDSAMIARLASTGDAVLVATAHVLSGQTGRAQSALNRAAQNRRHSMPGDFTVDAAVPEARLWLRMGDSSRAIGILDSALASVRSYAPLSAEGASNNVTLIGSVVTALALRAELASRSDAAAARRWGRAAVALLAEADPALQPKLHGLMMFAR